jgi:hypothetical protein
MLSLNRPKPAITSQPLLLSVVVSLRLVVVMLSFLSAPTTTTTTTTTTPSTTTTTANAWQATTCCAFREEHWSLAISTFSMDTTITQFEYNGVRVSLMVVYYVRVLPLCLSDQVSCS